MGASSSGSAGDCKEATLGEGLEEVQHIPVMLFMRSCKALWFSVVDDLMILLLLLS